MGETSPTRKPAASRRPPVIVPPPPGGVLDYQQPRRQKSLYRRIVNHIRFHYEDRMGNIIMWIVGPIIIIVIFLLPRISLWVRLFRLMFNR
jgi:hypothetical protein